MNFMPAPERLLYLKALKSQQDNGSYITIAVDSLDDKDGAVRHDTVGRAQAVADQLPSTFRLLLSAFDYRVTLAPKPALSYGDRYRLLPAERKLWLSPSGMVNNKTACIFSANESAQWVIIHEIGHCVDGALQLLYVAAGHDAAATLAGTVCSNRSQHHDFTALATRIVRSGVLQTINHLERPKWGVYDETDMPMEIFAHSFQEYYGPVSPDSLARFEETMGELYIYMGRLEQEVTDLIEVALAALNEGRVDDYLQL